MQSFSKKSKLLIIFVLVALICVVIYRKFVNRPNKKNKLKFNNSITNFSASLSKFGDRATEANKFFIKFTYTNPNPFTVVTPEGGTSADVPGYPIFYLLDYKDANGNLITGAPTDTSSIPVHPPVADLINQKYLATNPRSTSPSGASQKFTPEVPNISTNYQTAGATVTGYIDKENESSDTNVSAFRLTGFQPAQGQQYYFGIALQWSQTLSGWGNYQLQHVYSDFTYVVLTAQDPSAPGTLTNFSNSNTIISYNNIYS
jgi:hypothetical protein